MKLYKVTDPEFRPYGKVIDPAGFEDLIAALAETNCPKDAIEYIPSVPSLEETAGGKEISARSTANARSRSVTRTVRTPS